MLEIFDATSEDAESVIGVQKTTWLATYPNAELGITKKDIEEMFANFDERVERWRKSIKEFKDRRTWVVKNGNLVVGFCGAGKSKERNEIGSIYILPEYQSQGAGKMLVNRAMEWLGEKQDVYVCVAKYNHPAIEFYKKFGFKIKGEVKKVKLHKFPEIEMVRKY